VELYGVEGVATGFDANMFQGLLPAMKFQREQERDRLDDRLDREFMLVVTDRELLAIDGHYADAEEIRISLAQFGNVARHFACIVAAMLFVKIADAALQFGDVVHGPDR